MEFQLLFLFSFVLGSMFHEDKVSSPNKFEEVFAQSQSYLSPFTARKNLYGELFTATVILDHSIPLS